jgi:hypothetical protein
VDSRYKASAQEFLHGTRRWLSELDSWSIELMFLQRMLDIYGLKAEHDGQSERVRSLKSRIGILLSDETENLRGRLHEHEEHLQQILADRLLLQDRELPYKHADAEKAVSLGRSQFIGIQTSAFALVDELKRN